MSQTEEIALVQEAKDGSSEAIGTLFERFGTRLYAMIRSKMGSSLQNRVDPEDVLQNTMLKAFEKIDQFDGNGPTTLLGWMAIIAHHEMRDQARFHQRGKRDNRQNTAIATKHRFLADKVRSQTSALVLKEEWRILEDALNQLESDHKEIVVMRKLQELSFAEIGERMGRSPDACRMLLARAMTKLTQHVPKDLLN